MYFKYYENLLLAQLEILKEDVLNGTILVVQYETMKQKTELKLSLWRESSVEQK